MPDPTEAATLPPSPSQTATLAPSSDTPSDARAPAGYVIERELGRGGMGVVYLARSLALDRLCALKMILSGAHAGSDEASRFRTEAQAAARLSHPGIAQVYEVGEHDGRPFLALEYCAGGGLDARLVKGPLPAREAAALVKKLAEAVQAAHEAKVLHRDLKPANVLLSEKGEPKVTDFGLAKKLDEQGATRTGSVMGTPSYMPPEQAEGKKDIGPAADVYSLGAILYECLAARPPFKAATAFDTIMQVLTEEAPSLRTLNRAAPADLETICAKCLRKEPGRRYATAQDLADDLGRWLAGEPIQARPVGPVERAVKWARRRPGAATALCGSLAAVAAVVALAAVASYQWRKAEAALKRVEEEQERRALAQIDQLRDAAPGVVPAILEAVGESREEILPNLRERHAGEADPARKARLALALLPFEPAVRGELVVRMLGADEPAEAILIRDVLRPHSAGLAEGLWARAGDERSDRDERLRALVALAAFDPGSERWKQAAPPLVRRLLSSNSLHLGTWVLALEPVSGFLYGPLGESFRDEKIENAGQRQAAAQALRLYLSRRPDFATLYDLLLDSDAEQFALLRPLLDRHQTEAAARLSVELRLQPVYWKDPPLDPAWKNVDAAIVAEIEKGRGIVAGRWALCQALPMARLSAVGGAMGKAGYRPLSVRAWGRHQAAVVWTRDGVDWKLDVALTLEELKVRDKAHQKAGLIPADVAAYPVGGGDRYVALWRRGGKEEKAVMYAGVPGEKHRSQVDANLADGYAPARVHAASRDGATSYSGVWVKDQGKDPVKGKGPTEGRKLRWDNDEALYAGHVADGGKLLLDVSVSPGAPPRPARGAWLADLDRARADEKAKPDNLDAVTRRGIALYNLGLDREALKAFDDLVARGSGGMGLRYRALLHAKAGDAAAARRDLSAFKKASASRALVSSAAALVGLYLGEGDALRTLEAAVKEHPWDGGLAYEAARVYARACEHAGRREFVWSASLVAAPSPPALALRPEAGLKEKYTRRAMQLLRLALARGHGDFATMHKDADLEAVGSYPGYHDLLREHGQLRRYASVWSDDATREAEALRGLSAVAHLERCRDLAARGYRPAALSLADLPGEKGPVAASVWHRPDAPEEKARLAKRQATAGAILLTLGKTEEVWPLFRHSAEPERRSWLTWRAGERGADPRLLIERLLKEQDMSARRALIVALGEYDEKALPAEVRGALVKTLLGWYRDDPDPGVHSAIGWLLRNSDEGATARKLDWGQAKALDAIDREAALNRDGELAKKARKGGGAGRDGPHGVGWYVNGQGQTLAMINGPVDLRCVPGWRGDLQLRRIDRSYAIASTSVTVAQYRRFLKDNPDVQSDFNRTYSPEEDSPIINVDWYAAARYCNWLSAKEGIPEDQWVYPRQIRRGTRMAEGHLSRTGYRLPTSAEWQYAAKAGSEQGRPYGTAVEMLPRYAHFRDNSKERAWPVGRKRPNDLGLFDVQGNAYNWCHDKVRFHHPGRTAASPEVDAEDVVLIDNEDNRYLFGGSYFAHASWIGSANGRVSRSDNRNIDNGLRVCRTLPPDSFPALPSPR